MKLGKITKGMTEILEKFTPSFGKFQRDKEKPVMKIEEWMAEVEKESFCAEKNEELL